MELLPHQLIVYDGACPLCLSLRDKVLRWKIFPSHKVVNYYALPPEQSAQIDPEIFRHQMAVIDTNGGATIYGADGIRHIFSERFWLAKMFFAIPGIMTPIRFMYKTLAHNRYIVSTPRKDMPVCNCKMADTPAIFHFTYLLFCLLVAVGVTFFFGAGLAQYFDGMSKLDGGLAMLLIAGTGWCVQGLLTVMGIGKLRFEYIRHMFTVMRIGVMPLLPIAILLQAIPGLPIIFPIMAVLFSSILMLRQHYLRVWQLRISQAWTWSWFLGLQGTAMAWIFFFFPHLIQ